MYEDVSDFGKKGKVKANNQLQLDGLSFFPNPAPDGQLRLQFDTPEEGQLTIKVYNLNGKEVWSRYFEQYSGRYAEIIDLSKQQKGIYLLEITLNDKRLTRKIAID